MAAALSATKRYHDYIRYLYVVRPVVVEVVVVVVVVVGVVVVVAVVVVEALVSLPHLNFSMSCFCSTIGLRKP